MELDLYRYSSGRKSTQGVLLRRTIGKRIFLCYTLEDEYRTKKVYGETRIPFGRYRLKLRKAGPHHEKYAQRFADIHKGMLELVDVPGFEDVLIHIGNTDDDTAGCILVGDGAVQNVTQDGALTNSTTAYQRIYPLIADLVESPGSSVWLNVIDLDTPEP